MITNAEDLYDSLVVDVGCILGDMRVRMDELEAELLDADISMMRRAIAVATKLELQKWHDKLNEVL